MEKTIDVVMVSIVGLTLATFSSNKPILIVSFLILFIGYYITKIMIPILEIYVIKKNHFGYDLNKKGTK